MANAGAGASNYTGFVLGFDGVLHPLPGSTVALPDGSQPGDVLFNATGSKLAATRVATSLIDSFVVGHDGHLHAAPGAPYAAPGPGPFGSQVRPTDPGELYVSNAHGGQHAVSQPDRTGTGRRSPEPQRGHAVRRRRRHQSGQRLPSARRQLTELPFSPTALPAGAKPFGIVVS